MPLTDPKHLKKVTTIIKIAAIKQGFRGEELRDCVQEILTKKLEGNHAKASAEQAVIDYIIQRQSNSRNKNKRVSDRTFINDISTREMHASRNLTLTKDSNLLFDGLYKKLENKEDKIIFKMYFRWGFTNSEIADFFEVSESAIDHRLAKIKKRLKVLL